MRCVGSMAPCGLPAAQQGAGRSPPFALAAGAFVQALAVKLEAEQGARAAQRPSSREQGLKAALGHARQSVRAANRTYSCTYHIAFVVDGHSECAPPWCTH